MAAAEKVHSFPLKPNYRSNSTSECKGGGDGCSFMMKINERRTHVPIKRIISIFPVNLFGVRLKFILRVCVSECVFAKLLI